MREKLSNENLFRIAEDLSVGIKYPSACDVCSKDCKKSLVIAWCKNQKLEE